MKIYTRTGDEGETSLFGGGRVPKDHLRVEAYGTVDELNAALGRAIGTLAVAETRERVTRLQHDLFAIGAHLATPPPAPGRRAPELPPLPEVRIEAMEGWMDEAEKELPPLRAFILPGGSAGAAELHLCRTICRRAERVLLPLLREDTRGHAAEAGAGEVRAGDADRTGSAARVDDGAPRESDGKRERAVGEPSLSFALRYLNRLSDLLFVLARLENARSGVAEVEWMKEEG